MASPKTLQIEALACLLAERFPEPSASSSSSEVFFRAYVTNYLEYLNSPDVTTRIFVDGHLHGEQLSPVQLAAMAMADAQRVSGCAHRARAHRAPHPATAVRAPLCASAPLRARRPIPPAARPPPPLQPARAAPAALRRRVRDRARDRRLRQDPGLLSQAPPRRA